MGLVTGLVTLPLTGPVRAGWWVVEQLVAHAEAELYDEDRIVAELRDLTARVERGDVTEEQHAAAEAALLERLAVARAHRRALTEETP